MTEEQVVKRVKEIMEECEINYTKEKEIEMALAYSYGRTDATSEDLKIVTGETK